MLSDALLYSLAYKVKSRADACHATIELDDLVQEARIVELRCEKTHKQNGGASFETYASRSILRHLNTLVDAAIQKTKFECDERETSEFYVSDSVQRLMSGLNCEIARFIATALLNSTRNTSLKTIKSQLEQRGVSKRRISQAIQTLRSLHEA